MYRVVVVDAMDDAVTARGEKTVVAAVAGELEQENVAGTALLPFALARALALGPVKSVS